MRQFDKMSKRYVRVEQEQKYESKMTSEQKYHSIAQSVLGAMSHTPAVVTGCPMHPKISKKCRKCQEIQCQLQIKQKQEQFQLDDSFPDLIKINTNNNKSHFNEKLQNNVQNSYLFKTKLRGIMNVRQLVNDLTSDEISIDTYISGSTQNPTVFFSYFYRLAELRPTKEQISIMLRANNVNVRCMALLYLRVFADPTIVYGCMHPSFKDHKLLNVQTIGEYAMRLFDQEKLDHGGFRLPRLPIKIQRAIAKKISQIQENREKQFQRERERSRERERTRRQEYEEEMRKVRENRKEPSPSEQSQHEDEEKGGKPSQPVVPLSLKEKIKQIQQKKAEEARRLALLNSYKSETANKLQSEDEAYSENDSVQKIHMG